MVSQAPIFLAVGNLTLDLQPDRTCKLGGASYYSGVCAHSLGCRTRILSGAGPDLDHSLIPGHLETCLVPGDATTCFENRYNPDLSRVQLIHQPGPEMSARHLPRGWSRPDILLACPVFGEVNRDLVDSIFADIKGLSIQGMLRMEGPEKRVFAKAVESDLLPLVDVIYYSEEDLAGIPEMAPRLRQKASMLVETRGARGAAFFMDGCWQTVPGYPVKEVDPTGAGDTFAAAHLVGLARGMDLWEAADFACRVASFQVSIKGPFVDEAGVVCGGLRDGSAPLDSGQIPQETEQGDGRSW